MRLKDKIRPKLPALVADYLNQADQTAAFYRFSPDLAGLKEAYAERARFPVNRKCLVSVLRSQTQNSNYANALTLHQIDSLMDENVVTVTTGHQLCLYGGPLFFFYKILSTISLVRTLKEEGIEAIPIYWMASEDHDFDEINHIFRYDSKFVWETHQSGAVGEIKLNDVDDFKREVQAAYGSDYRYSDTLNELDKIFSADKSLSQAIREFVYWVFADEGVVVLDANDVELKSKFEPVITKELKSQSSYNALLPLNKALKAAGFTPQVNGREINLFWLDDSYRERIDSTALGFETADKKFSWDKQKLLDTVKFHPEKFSPNVILRPIYQELILPNIAYIGGPGETSYWLQLKGVFDAFESFMPVVLLRDMVILIDEPTEKRMDKLGLESVDLLKDKALLFTEMVRKKGTNEGLVDDAKKSISHSLHDLTKDILKIDASLGQSAETESVRILKRLDVLRSKLLRHDKRKSDELHLSLERILSKVYVNGVPQERKENWLSFFADPKSITHLLPWMDPLDDLKLKLICLE